MPPALERDEPDDLVDLERERDGRPPRAATTARARTGRARWGRRRSPRRRRSPSRSAGPTTSNAREPIRGAKSRAARSTSAIASVWTWIDANDGGLVLRGEALAQRRERHAEHVELLCEPPPAVDGRVRRSSPCAPRGRGARCPRHGAPPRRPRRARPRSRHGGPRGRRRGRSGGRGSGRSVVRARTRPARPARRGTRGRSRRSRGSRASSCSWSTSTYVGGGDSRSNALHSSSRTGRSASVARRTVTIRC